MIPREGQSQAAQTYIAPNTEPVENKTVLPQKRELKWFKKGIPWTILNEYPATPPCPYGTLQEDNGSGKIPLTNPR